MINYHTIINIFLRLRLQIGAIYLKLFLDYTILYRFNVFPGSYSNHSSDRKYWTMRNSPTMDSDYTPRNLIIK